MVLIDLTDAHGDKIYVNMDTIVQVIPFDDGSMLVSTATNDGGNRFSFYVAEKPSIVASRALTAQSV